MRDAAAPAILAIREQQQVLPASLEAHSREHSKATGILHRRRRSRTVRGGVAVGTNESTIVIGGVHGWDAAQSTWTLDALGPGLLRCFKVE